MHRYGVVPLCLGAEGLLKELESSAAKSSGSPIQILWDDYQERIYVSPNIQDPIKLVFSPCYQFFSVNL